MQSRRVRLVVSICYLFLFHASAATLYVDVNSTNPMPPYAGWSTAATNIQDAVDTANSGDQILVTNGVYQTGGRTVSGYALTNRVVIDKAVTVQSLNGPAVTIIQGYQVTGTTNGDSAVRCVYLADGAILDGFTITEGATRKLAGDATFEQSGGGVWCQSTNVLVSSCIIVGNACFWWGAGAYRGTLNNCVVSDNSNLETSPGGGGGAAFSTLLNCTISGNLALATQSGTGGGAFSCILSNCLVSGNTDGGVSSSTLNNCVISNNVATWNGGGAYQCILTNCVLCNNQTLSGAGGYGGGAYDCTLSYCTVSNNMGVWGGGVFSDNTFVPGQSNILAGNSASRYGGGFYFAANVALSNWTFISNSASIDGGGLYLDSPASTVSSCIFSGNSAGGNGGGLSGVFPNLNAVSNCVLTGNTAAGNGGGAYYAVLYNCSIVGNRATNGGGVYGGIENCVVNGNTATMNGGGVYFTTGNFGNVCTNSAFTNNLAANGGGAYGGNWSNCIFSANIAITNGGGAYVLGGTLRNCLVVSNQAASGGGGYSGTYTGCSFMGNLATNSGGGIYDVSYSATNCVFGNNFAANNGGGAYGGTLGHCTIFGNGAANGGGVFNASLSRCSLSNNCAAVDGGGAYGSGLMQCLLVGNSATYGGGGYNVGGSSSTFVDNIATNAGGGIYFASFGGIVSSIIYYNSAPSDMNCSGSATFMSCCTYPLPSVGTGNISNAPAFVNQIAGNYRLQTNSPCINAGSGSVGTIDLDGRPGVVGGKIDMGAYEFQGAGVGEFIAWLQQYGLPTDGSVDYVDSDGDGLNNWQEWIAGTNPTNALSVLELLSPVSTNTPAGLVVTWESVSGITYFLQSSTNLGMQPAFSAIQSNIVGQAGTTSYTDTNAVGSGPFFYRVGVQ